MSTAVKSHEYDRMLLAFRDEILIHLAKNNLHGSNYVTAQDLAEGLFLIMEEYGIKRGSS